MKNLLENKTGLVKIKARFSNFDGPLRPEWQAPQIVTIEIIRREISLPRAKKRGDFAGDILAIYIKDFNWAEYGLHDYCGENQWMAEEWRMQVLEVEPFT